MVEAVWQPHWGPVYFSCGTLAGALWSVFSAQGECNFVFPVLDINVISSYAEYGQHTFLLPVTLSDMRVNRTCDRGSTATTMGACRALRSLITASFFASLHMQPL